MGIQCYHIQIPEVSLMHLDEAIVPEMFCRAREYRVRSLDQLRGFESMDFPRPETPALWLEKSWWSLHLLLTGKVAEAPEEFDPRSPISRSILGGREIGRELQQGPARFLWADEVREISAALSSLSREDLRRRFDHVRRHFNEEVLTEEDYLFLVNLFDALAAYYRIAAARGNAMLLGLD